MKKPIVRIAPSPTGNLHIGTARTALFNFLFARNKGGKFLLRMEDTDEKRSTFLHEKDIIESLSWLNIVWDGKIERQMKRLHLYKEYSDQLLKENKAYYCFCSSKELEEERKRQLARKQPPRYSGKCRNLSKKEIESKIAKGLKPTIRLEVPENRGKIEFDDLIRGKIKEEAAIMGDFVLVKSSGVPVFFFAGVVDDYLQEISHVIRGEDHISNTFNQILIYEALGLEKKLPKYAHLPLILNADRSKMSKRKGDMVSVAEFRKRGYLPQALVNFIALLGWHPRTKVIAKSSPIKEQEIYKLDEFIKLFDIKNVGKSASIFDQQKLNFINSQYIHQLSNEKIKKLLIPDHIGAGWEKNKDMILKAIRLVKDRMKTLADFPELAEYFFEKPIYDKEILVFEKSNTNNTRKGLELAIKSLSETKTEEWQEEILQKILENVVKNNSLTNGDVFWPVRTALSGRQASPSPVELLFAFGKKESLERLRDALERLK